MPERVGKLSVGLAILASAGLITTAILNLDAPDALLLIAAGISYGCGRYSGLRAGVPATALLLAALIPQGDSFVPFVLCTVAPWVAGRALRSREEMLDSLEQRKRELEFEQDALSRLSVGRERARIARELHDIVAHHLAVIVVQAGAGRMAKDGDGAAERFARIRQSGDEALDEMSRLVDMLQTDEAAQRTDYRLEVLVDQARAAGLQLRSDGLPAESLRPDIEQLAYRLVQEGLTNAMKHAPGSEVRLHISLAGGALEIALANTGGSAPSNLAGAGSGMGLGGLRERVESLGGRFDAGPFGAAGWRLHACVPIA